MKTTKRTIGTAAVVAVLGLGLLGAGAVKTGAATQQPAYKSSIQVTDDGDGRKGDHREERRRRDGESAEAARLASLAKIDAGQAAAAAVGHVPGTALRTALENEDANVVYEVQIRTGAGQITKLSWMPARAPWSTWTSRAMTAMGRKTTTKALGVSPAD